MAKETIYLCNFRVSVDGDWLCLQELNDLELNIPNPIQEVQVKDPLTLERCNLLNVLKLVIKEILDSSLSHGQMLDEAHTDLQQFFVILEHILLHRLKPKKGLLRDKRDFWDVLSSIEKVSNEAKDITTSVRELPNVKSSLGRGRAWLRLALMQKKLADYFRILIDNKNQMLVEFYDDGAIMIEEEAMIIGGLLVGLNVIDCNIAVKDEDLDKPMGVIDFGLYLKDPTITYSNTPMELSRGSKQMAAILDQKNYLEELNRHLSATVANLQDKLEGFQTANTLIREDVIIANDNVTALHHENSQLRHQIQELGNIIEEKTKIIKIFQEKLSILCKEKLISKEDITKE